jgi:hypothetical protein
MEKQIEGIELDSIAGGAVRELFADAMKSVVANIQDPNTDYKEARKISVELTFKPEEDRKSASIKISVNRKTSPVKSVKTFFYLGMQNGEPVAMEHNPQQMTFDSMLEEAPESPKINIAQFNKA